MLNLFRDSWAYQDMVAEGKQEGKQKGLQEGKQEGLQEGKQKGLQEGQQEGQQKALQETCIRYVQKRFPTLADRAKQQINSLTDVNRLYMTFDTIMDATTVAEVEEILAHLYDEPQSTQ
jgi:flagellar biosynthesis/type III secretory pathway protein FliH